jgi:hypothetical protein
MSIFKDDLDKAMFFSGLKDLGVEKLVAEYSGGDDSGAIDTVYAENTEGDHIDLGDFHDRVENFMYEILSTKYDYDWYNNDGGSGTVYFDINTLEYDVHGYVMVSQEAFHSGILNIDDID